MCAKKKKKKKRGNVEGEGGDRGRGGGVGSDGVNILGLLVLPRFVGIGLVLPCTLRGLSFSNLSVRKKCTVLVNLSKTSPTPAVCVPPSLPSSLPPFFKRLPHVSHPASPYLCATAGHLMTRLYVQGRAIKEGHTLPPGALPPPARAPMCASDLPVRIVEAAS